MGWAGLAGRQDPPTVVAVEIARVETLTKDIVCVPAVLYTSTGILSLEEEVTHARKLLSTWNTDTV